MDLPVMPPVRPMLAKAAAARADRGEIPGTDGLWYEPKWDGFRCIVFRDGDEVELGSRNDRPLTRYFPEMIQPLRDNLPDRCVVDGELVVMGPERLEFEWLQQRIHPAESRIAKLSREIPASYVAFDLLATGDEDLRQQPFEARRARLANALAGARPPVHVTPITTDADVASDWFHHLEGAGLDGIIAKDGTGTYRENERGWVKVKHVRTADCVVAGFRWHKSGDGVGSLLLGLYDGDGNLHHVGVATSFTAARRKELTEELAGVRGGPEILDDHPWREWALAEAHGDSAQRMPGAPSRWSGTKDLSWEPVRPELVVEVGYDHLQGDRFRHATRMLRWRPDRDPTSCTYDQMDRPPPVDLSQVFG